MIRPLALAPVLLLAACAVGPDYREPAVPVGASYRSDETAPPRDDAGLRDWWRLVHDGRLTALVETVLAGNRDLRAAASHLQAAMARHGVVASGAWPVLDAQGGVQRRDPSDRTGEPDPRARTTWSAGLAAGWELDLWGAVRRTSESANAGIAASGYGFADVRRLLAAEAVRTVGAEVVHRRRGEIARSLLSNRERFAELRRRQVAAGLASADAVDGAQAEVLAARTVPNGLFATATRARLRLAELAGRVPTDLLPVLDAIPQTAVDANPGLPAELLRRRPDVRRAERNLAAAVARIGIAEAELYPRLSLNGSIGVEARTAGDLGAGGASTWTFGPSLRWRIFEAGRVRALVREADAEAAASVADYEAAVLRAQREVADALTTLDAVRTTHRDRLAEVAALSAVESRVAARAASGLADPAEGLEAERNRLAAEDRLVQAQSECFNAFIALASALGGGWRSDLDPVAQRLDGPAP